MHKYRRDFPFPLTATKELAGSPALSQAETAWQDSHEGRKGGIPVISSGPDLVEQVTRWCHVVDSHPSCSSHRRCLQSPALVGPDENFPLKYNCTGKITFWVGSVSFNGTKRVGRK